MPTKTCLSCGETQPLTEFAYGGSSLFCDVCRWEGRTQAFRAEAKVLHERNRRKRLRAARMAGV